MRVECKKIINPFTEAEDESSAFLTVGKVYDVLAVYVAPGGVSELVCLSDDNAIPMRFDIDQFEILDGALPSVWRSALDFDGRLCFGPEKWMRPDFWSRYYDGDERAIYDFQTEAALVLDESF